MINTFKKKTRKKKAFSVHRFLHFFIVLGLNLNDGKVTWMSYISNMQGKGIFERLLIPPGLKRDVSHGCAPFQAICSLERRKKSRRRRRGSPHKPNSLRPWFHETGTNSDRYGFRSVSIQMLVSVYIRLVWKIISCRFHSFRLLNRHEWLGPVWSRTTEPCKHELIWDQSKITVLSMRMSAVGPFQDAENRKESKENESRWIFRDSMVEDLLEALDRIWR